MRPTLGFPFKRELGLANLLISFRGTTKTHPHISLERKPTNSNHAINKTWYLVAVIIGSILISEALGKVYVSPLCINLDGPRFTSEAFWIDQIHRKLVDDHPWCLEIMDDFLNPLKKGQSCISSLQMLKKIALHQTNHCHFQNGYL